MFAIEGHHLMSYALTLIVGADSESEMNIRQPAHEIQEMAGACLQT